MTETNRIEYKAQLTKDLELEKEVVAFLNYHEGGLVYIGIDKNGKTIGVKDQDADMLKIKDRIKNKISPSAMGFVFSDNFIRMVFPSAEPVNKEEDKESSKERLVDGLVDGLAESQQKIIQLILNNPRISKRKMAESIGISTTAIDNNIKTLKDKAIIERVGSDRTGYWKIRNKE